MSEGIWRKSSYSAYNGNCCEVGTFRTSSHSAYNGSCVEAGSCCCGVGVRDSKLTDSPVLTFGTETWARFLAETKAALPRR
jgi:hypothetical protein